MRLWKWRSLVFCCLERNVVLMHQTVSPKLFCLKYLSSGNTTLLKCRYSMYNCKTKSFRRNSELFNNAASVTWWHKCLKNIHHGSVKQLLSHSFRVNDVTEDIKWLSLELGDKTISATCLLCKVEQFAESESCLEKCWMVSGHWQVLRLLPSYYLNIAKHLSTWTQLFSVIELYVSVGCDL